MRYRTDDGRFVYLDGTFIGAARDDFDAGSFVNELNLLRDALRVAVAAVQAYRNHSLAEDEARMNFNLRGLAESQDKKRAAISAFDNNDQIRRVRGEVKDG